MKSTALFCAVILVAAVLVSGQSRTPTASGSAAGSFKVTEVSLAELQRALAAKRTTSHEIVAQYLIRLALYEHVVHAAIAVNPHALEQADVLDRERAAGHLRGPLHGIPVALKDNIHTIDMPTTGGALAFAGLIPPYQATLTKNLLDAGAIIIAKTGLTELANWVAGAPDPMPGNYNAVGGFGYNPYDPRPDPRPQFFDGRPALQTGGSSSGIGTAASFWAANVGSDTGGSVISPSNANMLVGIRPTIGRISRYGVIPITADHDTAGPMTRTVTDVAIMLGALESPSPDPNDAATQTCTPPPGRDYTKFLNADGLKGARIGIPRVFYYDRATLPGDEDSHPSSGAGRGGLNPDQAKAMADAIAVLKARGAIVVDPADVPSFVAKDEAHNFLMFDYCSGADQARGKDEHCSVNFKYGMKRDFNAWLTEPGRRRAGAVADGAARMEPRPREGRRDQVRTVAPRYLGRDGPRARQGTQRCRPQEGLAAQSRGRNRRRAGAATPGRDPHARRLGRRPRRPRRLPDHRGAVRHGAECTEPAVSGRLQREARAVRRRVYRHLVQ